MNNAELVGEGDGRFALRGQLDFATVDALLRQGNKLFDGVDPVVLNLKGVTRANSAGFALLLEWLDRAHQQGRNLYVVHLPQSLVDIARISNGSELLPVKASL